MTTATAPESPLVETAKLCTILPPGAPFRAAMIIMARLSMKWAELNAMPESDLVTAARADLQEKIDAFDAEIVGFLLSGGESAR